MEYPTNDAQVQTTVFEDSKELEMALSRNLADDPSIRFRLFVVEDLSRCVVEALGYHLKVDPSFFREHIVDSARYNFGTLG